MAEISEQMAIFNVINKEVDDLYHDISERMGLSDSALILIYGICYAGHPCTQKELCDTWSLRKQTVNSSLSKMIKEGYVKIEEADNQRVKRASLTAKGEELAKRTALPLMEAESKAFGRLTEAEREQLLKLSQKYLDYMKQETKEL